MTYDQFWNEDVELVRFYRKAWDIRQEQRNHELWLQGAYIYDALARVYPLFNPFVRKGTQVGQYPEKPYVFEKRKKETQEHKTDDKAKAMMEVFMVNFNKRFEQKGGGDHGSER